MVVGRKAQRRAVTTISGGCACESGRITSAAFDAFHSTAQRTIRTLQISSVDAQCHNQILHV